MLKRTSVVSTAKVNSVEGSSLFQIGDSFAHTPKAKGYAIGQLSDHIAEDKGDNVFSQPLFQEAIPRPSPTSQVNMTTFHEVPFIHVKHIKINAIGESSILQIGSVNYIQSEARVKHVRRMG